MAFDGDDIGLGADECLMPNTRCNKTRNWRALLASIGPGPFELGFFIPDFIGSRQ
ncbi:hypothetical protein SAMN04490191_0255 [Pseudomonas lini]|nr:hypothetical protein SAMN04490191_0255 [Pseudomonas lini]